MRQSEGRTIPRKDNTHETDRSLPFYLLLWSCLILFGEHSGGAGSHLGRVDRALAPRDADRAGAAAAA